MKQTIVIINEPATINSDTILKGCGGSETWTIEIAKQFSKHGFNVMIFSPFAKWESLDGIQYIPIHIMDDILSYTMVDYFFIRISCSMMTFIKNNIIKCISIKLT